MTTLVCRRVSHSRPESDLKENLRRNFHALLVGFIHATPRDSVLVLAPRSLYTPTDFVFYVDNSAMVVSIANLYAVCINGKYKDNIDRECCAFSGNVRTLRLSLFVSARHQVAWLLSSEELAKLWLRSSFSTLKSTSRDATEQCRPFLFANRIHSECTE